MLLKPMTRIVVMLGQKKSDVHWPLDLFALAPGISAIETKTDAKNGIVIHNQQHAGQSQFMRYIFGLAETHKSKNAKQYKCCGANCYCNSNLYRDHNNKLTVHTSAQMYHSLRVCTNRL